MTEELRPLGRHVEHDERSRAYPAKTAEAALKPVYWKRHGKVFDQGQLGSCTGNALAGALNTDPLRKPHVKLLVEKDAVALYELATTLDGVPGSYPPDDTGSSGLAVCRAAVKKGLLAGYTHAFGIDHALGSLQLGPVITGVDWYEGFDTPGPGGLVKIAGEVRGGHEFEVLGFDPSKKLVRAVNSWGPEWGERGYFTFTVATWAQLLAAKGDVTVPVAALAPKVYATATVHMRGLGAGVSAWVDPNDPHIAMLLEKKLLVVPDESEL